MMWAVVFGVAGAVVGVVRAAGLLMEADVRHLMG